MIKPRKAQICANISLILCSEKYPMPRFIPLFILFLQVVLSSPLMAQQRLALVIGNADYAKISPLSNPINDASDIAAKLSSLNFKVTLKTDQTHPQMMASVRKFSQKIAAGDIALVLLCRAWGAIQ